MNKKKEPLVMRVNLEIEFGSQWQVDVQKDSLILLLKAWGNHFITKHKDNNMNIKITKNLESSLW